MRYEPNQVILLSCCSNFFSFRRPIQDQIRPNRPPLPELNRPERQPPSNSPPYLQAGRDLLNFEITEDTAVGSVVYTLQGIDPEGANVLYTISGDHFSVNRNTGVITLIAPLDREVKDLLDVVVTIQDENFEQIGKSVLEYTFFEFDIKILM